MEKGSLSPNECGILRRRDHVSLATLLAIALVAMVGSWLGHRGRLVDIDRAPSKHYSFRVDINKAAWPELTLLPRIGETLARRIVDSRQAEGAFHKHDELLRVKGIGPRTLEGIRPYLLPLKQKKRTGADRENGGG
jgi:competence protein ComEA